MPISRVVVNRFGGATHSTHFDQRQARFLVLSLYGRPVTLPTAIAAMLSSVNIFHWPLECRCRCC